MRKPRAITATLNEMVNARPTMITLLIRLPTIGSRPHKNVTAITSGAYGSRIITTNNAVNVVLISEMVIWAPITVAKLR
jgi:hypothetical protein